MTTVPVMYKNSELDVFFFTQNSALINIHILRAKEAA